MGVSAFYREIRARLRSWAGVRVQLRTGRSAPRHRGTARPGRGRGGRRAGQYARSRPMRRAESQESRQPVQPVANQGTSLRVFFQIVAEGKVDGMILCAALPPELLAILDDVGQKLAKKPFKDLSREQKAEVCKLMLNLLPAEDQIKLK